MLQKCSDLHLGNIELVDKLILEGWQKSMDLSWWCFDVLRIMQMDRKIGGLGYDWLILFNRFVNSCLKFRERTVFFSKNKTEVKKKQSNTFQIFEEATELAIEKKSELCDLRTYPHEPKIIK
jgi:transposase